MVKTERTTDNYTSKKTWVEVMDAPQVHAAPDHGGIPSKSDIARMPKAEVIEWLEAHGVENPDGKVGFLRDKLTQIMFVG